MGALRLFLNAPSKICGRQHFKKIFIYLFISVFRSKVLTFHVNLADDSHAMSRFVFLFFVVFFF